MKKRIFYAYIFALIVLMLSFATAEQCTDTDNGINYNTKGSISGKSAAGSVYNNFPDSCLEAPSLQSNLVSSSKYLGEFYCENDVVSADLYTCPNGCKDGACIVASNKTCIDTDGGLNTFVKGYGTGFLYNGDKKENTPDKCTTQAGKEQLLEWFCSDAGNLALYYYDCPNGCKDGACLPETPAPIPSNLTIIPGLIANYKFEDNAIDSIGNNHGVINGDVKFVEGKIGKAASFDGVDDYVNFESLPSLDQDFNQLSISFWMLAKSTTGNDAGLVGKGTTVYGTTFHTDSNIYFYIDRGENHVAAPIVTGVWNHIVGVFNGSALQLYVNGVLTNTKNPSRYNSTRTEGVFSIGKAISYFNGSIDDVRIYNQALSTSEVLALYQTTTKTTCTDSDISTTKEIDQGGERVLAGLNVRVNSARENNLQLSASLTINSLISSSSITLSLTSDEPLKNIKVNNIVYTVELISASDGSATIRVTGNGKNYYSKGSATFTLCSSQLQGEACGGGGALDKCIDSEILSEAFCDETALSTEKYTCPNGCNDGACVIPIPSHTCQPLIDKLAATNEIYPGFIFKEKQTDDDFEGGPADLSIYNFENKELEKAISAGTIVLNNSLFNVTDWIDVIKNYVALSGDRINYNQVYVLTDIGEGNIMFWFNKNVLAFLTIGPTSWDYKAPITNIEEFITKLEDNEFDSIFDYSDPDYRILTKLANEFLALCPSEIDESCLPKWERKVEPVVCPEYGRQNVIIRDRYGCNDRIIENTKICSPGICSGCYIPRWLGYESRGNNICIPYTTRLAHESNEKERLTTKEIVPSSFTCIDDNTVELTLVYQNLGFNKTYTLYEDSVYTVPDDYIGEEIKFRVDNIVCNKGTNNYVDISILTNFNGYCDISGTIKKQKTKDTQGNWAKCQNNYECDSNLCSGGECVEINDAIRKTSRFKSLFIKVFCRLAHIFSEDNYNRCVGEYIGYSPVIDDWPVE